MTWSLQYPGDHKSGGERVLADLFLLPRRAKEGPQKRREILDLKAEWNQTEGFVGKEVKLRRGVGVVAAVVVGANNEWQAVLLEFF